MSGQRTRGVEIHRNGERYRSKEACDMFPPLKVVYWTGNVASQRAEVLDSKTDGNELLLVQHFHVASRSSMAAKAAGEMAKEGALRLTGLLA